MLHKLASSIMVKFWSWKHQNHIYQTVKFICDDCEKKGLALRQISVLNLAFWLLLGILATTALKLFGLGWWVSGTIGFVVWWGSTAINVKLNKPQCRHCLSVNIRMPEKTIESNAEQPFEQQPQKA